MVGTPERVARGLSPPYSEDAAAEMAPAGNTVAENLVLMKVVEGGLGEAARDNCLRVHKMVPDEGALLEVQARQRKHVVCG